MISDITLGQFFPGRSVFHRMDPRTKIILSLFYMVGIFCAKNIFVFAFLFFLTVMMVANSGLSVKMLLKSVKPLIFVLIFAGVLNLFFTTPPADAVPLVSFWRISIYAENIIRAFLMMLRVVMLVVGVSILVSYTTSPIALTDAIESLLSPLKKIKVPVHEFAMMMSIALRFIPTLVEETEKIMKAQKARGADFTSGNLFRRAKALIPILVPLFVSSFQHAMDLATAMECRCYRGGEGRTKLAELKYRLIDFVFLILGAVFLSLVFLGNAFIPFGYSL